MFVIPKKHFLALFSLSLSLLLSSCRHNKDDAKKDRKDITSSHAEVIPTKTYFSFLTKTRGRQKKDRGSYFTDIKRSSNEFKNKK